MAELTAAHARDLGDYVALVRRRWAWIAGAVVAGLVASMLFLSVAQTTYASTAKVLVQSTGSSMVTSTGARTNDSINLDTEAQLVQSAPVSTRAAELLGTTQSPVALARRVSVTVPPNTTVMAISFAAPTAQEAQRGAAAFAKAYLENRHDTAQDSLTAEIDRLEAKIEKLKDDIQTTGVAISGLTAPGERTDKAFLVARRSTLSAQLATYNTQLAPLDGTVVDPGEVILEAQLPAAPIDPNPFLVIPAGLMAGLVLGLGLAAWRERADKRVHSNAELERLFGLTPLITIAAGGRTRHARIAKDVRALYHSLRANGPDGAEVTLLVGPDSADTAEHLAYSLALVGARSGSPSALVTRPHSPVLEHRRRSDVEKSGVLQLPDYEDLGVMTEGELRSANLPEELRTLTADNDFVILGLPNDDPTVDLPILGRHVNAALVVIELGVTRRDTIARVLADLSKSGVDHVFAVTVDLGHRTMLRRRTTSAADAFVDSRDRADIRPLPTDRPAGESRQAASGKQHRPHEVNGTDQSLAGRDGRSRTVSSRRP